MLRPQAKSATICLLLVTACAWIVGGRPLVTVRAAGDLNLRLDKVFFAELPAGSPDEAVVLAAAE